MHDGNKVRQLPSPLSHPHAVDTAENVLHTLRGGVVVSAQAMNSESPLAHPRILSLLAQAAGLGGAAGYRVDGVEVITDLRHHTTLPIIGIRKDRTTGTDTFITPTVADALALVAAGADIVAAQATRDSRPAEPFSEVVANVHAAGALVMADISGYDEAVKAIEDGADMIATTLAGYTTSSAGAARPALDLVRRIRAVSSVPLVVEGGIWTGEHVAAAFKAGATTVVVGSAVTAPDLITQRLVAFARDAYSAAPETEPSRV
jgi:N-acylglucosamine-6-phosphate 2-epimerase